MPTRCRLCGVPSNQRRRVQGKPTFAKPLAGSTKDPSCSFPSAGGLQPHQPETTTRVLSGSATATLDEVWPRTLQHSRVALCSEQESKAQARAEAEQKSCEQEKASKTQSRPVTHHSKHFQPRKHNLVKGDGQRGRGVHFEGVQCRGGGATARWLARSDRATCGPATGRPQSRECASAGEPLTQTPPTGDTREPMLQAEPDPAAVLSLSRALAQGG